MSSLQQTGAISLNQIAAEFGVTSGAISLTDFYRGGSNVSATETVTSSATNAPSDNNPVSNFASVTGLTLTANLVTMTPDSSGNVKIHQKRRTQTYVSVQGELNKKYIYQSGDKLQIYANNNSFSSNFTYQGTWTSGTIDYTNNQTSPTGNNAEYTDTTWKNRVKASGDQHPQNPNATNNALFDITGDGELVVTAANSYGWNGGAGYQGFTLQIQTGDSSDAIVKRDDGTAFANNSSYAVTIVGSTTQTVQVGETITTVVPDSNNQYTCSYTPISNIQTANPSPPTSDSAVSDFGGVTGLTCTRTSTTNTTSTTTWVPSNGDNGGNNSVYRSAGSSVTLGSSNSNRLLYGARGRDESGTLSVSYSGGSTSKNFGTGGTIPINNTLNATGPYTLSPNQDADIGYAYRSVTSSTSTTFTYSFTNNTGYSVVISGSGVTTTTIPDGGTNNDAIAHPSGNFTIQYEVANAQAKNGNIPTSGAISFTDFYGTEDFT